MNLATTLKLTSACILFFNLTSCGKETVSSHASTANDVGTSDGQPINAKLFYNFPITTHRENFVKNVKGPSDDPDAGWKYSVGRNTDPSNDFGKSYALVTYWDEDNYDYGQTSLNLETGEIYYHVIHSGTFSVQAPSLGGDFYLYRQCLAGLKAYLNLAKASPEVLSYVDKILGSLVNNGAVDTAQLNRGHGEVPAVYGQSNTYTVSYKVAQERDIIVDFMQEDLDTKTYQFHYTWKAGGRAHVSAGSGVAEVAVVLPTALKGQSVCVFTKIVPTGAEYTKAIYESKTCFGPL